MSKIIGIDLGTTNSCLAVMEGGQPKVIPAADTGRNVTPSVVEPVKNLVGDVAKRQMILNSKNTIYSIKRLMGRKISDPEVKRTQTMVPYQIVSGKDNMATVEVAGKTYTPQEISAMILRTMKAHAEAYLGGPVDQAVITVPAYFDDSQRQATKQAGEIAGLKVDRIINEPTAAALAYGLDKKNAHTVAVYDLGGGTFDISILELGDGVFEVKATNGDTHLGGDDFDQEIMDWIVAEFKKDHGVDLKKDSQALQRIRDVAEKAKIELSSSLEYDINQPYITQKDGQPLHLNLKLTRAKLESIVEGLINKTLPPVKAALSDSKKTAKDIDEIVLVGGMTRMPKVIETVKNFFGKEPNRSVNPDEVVAVGAAIQGGVLTGDVKDVVLLDVTPLTLGLETLGSVMTPLIERNTTIPTSKSQIFSTASDSQMSVEIHVLQGERPMATDNKTLGRFILDGIPPAPRGVPQVEVSFDIDASGILKVSAKDKATGKSQHITITNSTNLDEKEVQRMREEAEKHSQQDAEKKSHIEARNQADSLIFTAEKTLKDAGDKASENLKKEVEDRIKPLKDILETGTKEDLEAKSKDLMDSLQKLGSSMYQQPSDQTAGPSDTSGDSNNQSSKSETKPEEGEVVN
ncbi:MAG: Chaperone protein DnaK [Candidatus Amesbacteria bacterium GW2011_GWB1_47_19]|nr:MAG: Chaperone protein DnaK [Candidatus Amesbacteria bacterium GW2011_GWA1_44_24]KKU32051.1 MAG: chaperone protein DnaK, molecular chaperone DnaK [Candidatus Amesbacteria bacterium GW2011_GWC1_46_24]KKU67735.1 MAG: Chaperone protein DnaK [Candidatus Amesbacteria bacterium GW2011_GWB1_47_19]OGD06080.1 MAG: molecular chaperone DnaK [Candidatus Amesbacteria bacterium RIFOXYB1_FULL_47_13]HBC72330.1 molecular chaperone DnaK [Candidatus Amesbacteria bacterium]